MMNFESVIQFFLNDTATLTSMVVSFACLFIHTPPILSVVREPSTLPAWAFLAVYIGGLPVTHTLTTAKVVFLYTCVLSTKLLPTPITVKYLASPSQKNAPAFMATGYLLGFLRLIQSVRLYCKRLSAHRTFESWGGSVDFAIRVFTGRIAKPQTGRIELYATRNPVKLITTGGTVDGDKCFHEYIIPYLVACQNLGRRGRAIEISPAYVAVALERMATAFPGIEIKRVK